MADALNDMLHDLSRTRPPVYLADEWQAWLAAVGQVIAAVPTLERKWACTVLLGDALARSLPGLSLPLAYKTIAEAVFTYEAVHGGRR